MAKAAAAKTRKIQTIVWAEEAAKGETHAERMQFIDRHVPEAFRAMVRDLMVDFLAVRVFEMPTKEARRAALDDIPVDCDPPWTRSLIECRVRFLWKNRKR